MNLNDHKFFSFFRKLFLESFSSIPYLNLFCQAISKNVKLHQMREVPSPFHHQLLDHLTPPDILYIDKVTSSEFYRKCSPAAANLHPTTSRALILKICHCVIPIATRHLQPRFSTFFTNL